MYIYFEIYVYIYIYICMFIFMYMYKCDVFYFYNTVRFPFWSSELVDDRRIANPSTGQPCFFFPLGLDRSHCTAFLALPTERNLDAADSWCQPPSGFTQGDWAGGKWSVDFPCLTHVFSSSMDWCGFSIQFQPIASLGTMSTGATSRLPGNNIKIWTIEFGRLE